MERDGRKDRRTLLRSAALGLAAATAPSWRAHSHAQTPASATVPPEGGAFLDRDATAEELANAWFAMLSLTGAETGVLGTTAEQDARSQEIIRPVLDPAFQLQRASGERYVRDTYVPSDIDGYEITEVLETRPSDTLVVARYAVRTPGASTADTSLVMSDELRPRLTVFHWDDAAAQWKVLSHGNFNTPVAEICDEAPLEPAMNPDVATSAEDIALGQSLIDGLIELALQGDVRPMLDPLLQSQSASGRGYTTIAGWRPTKYVKFEMADLLVTRNGDVLVTSYRGLQEGKILDVEVKTEWEPRVMTWRLDEAGEWKIVASMHFAEPQELPDGQACTPAG